MLRQAAGEFSGSGASKMKQNNEIKNILLSVSGLWKAKA